MAISNQITPGMTIILEKKIYRVESALKVAAAKGASFIKTKLRDLASDEVMEKNFKLDLEIKEVNLDERNLEFLYPESRKYLFLDVGNLEQVLIGSDILGEKINYLKEGVLVKARFYGQSVFSIELPPFLELMVVKTETGQDKMSVSNSTKAAILETGAKVEVPLFIETGDIIKVDTLKQEYIQRV
ncbi:MAG: elongation factor P [Parachlamydiales bacterium]|jgi:elongation factor P